MPGKLDSSDGPVEKGKKPKTKAAAGKSSNGATRRKTARQASATETPPAPETAADPLVEVSQEPTETELEAEAAPAAPPDLSQADELQPADVHDILREFAGVLSMFAWQRLGLVVDPFTGKIYRDLSQARVAIDTLAHLLEQIGDNATAEQRRALRTTLADLRINFVEQSKYL